MKNLFLNESDRSDIQFDLVSSNHDIRGASSLLYRAFDCTDKKHNHGDNPKQESKQLCKELFSLLYYNNDSQCEKPKKWAKSSFEKIQESEGFQALQDKCFLEPEYAEEATGAIIRALASEICELRKTQNEFIQDMDSMGIPKETAEEDFIPESDDVENLADKIAKIPTEILKSIEEGEKVEEMLGITAGAADESLASGGSAGKKLVQDIKRNPAIKKVLLLAGSLLDAMDSKTVKDQSTIENIVGIGFGRNLPDLTFGSKSLLCLPETEGLFYYKYSRNCLDVFEYEADTPKGRGPIWMLLDRSTSTIHSDRYIIINAIAVAAIHLAKKENRPILLVEFNGGVRGVFSMENGKCFKGSSPIGFQEMILQLAHRKPSGGTNFDKPLNLAMDKDPNAKQADIIMVTDGEAEISQNTVKRLESFKSNDMKLYTILLGVRSSALKDHSDVMVDLELLGRQDQESAIGSIMDQIRK